MQCTQTDWLSDEDYIISLRKKLISQRVPFSGSINLTNRCNLKCIHCYLGGGGDPAAKLETELNTKKWLSILDEVVQYGCMNLLITGGEPLLRKDFLKVYRYAKKSGMLVSVFTNGTLINRDVIAHFKEYPPSCVEISLYGATEKTYERITGVKGSYKRCLNGIGQLLDGGIQLNLKTILMTLNRHEIQLMRKMALDFGVRFRFDPGLFSRFNGDRTPMALRVPPEEVVALDFSDSEQAEKWGKHFDRFKIVSGTNRLYNCGAGVTTFHIDAWGHLKPCIMNMAYRHKLDAGTFMKGWRRIVPRIHKKELGTNSPCGNCEKRNLCGYCPPFSVMETGNETGRSKYLCKLGHLRYDAIKKGSMSNGTTERR